MRLRTFGFSVLMMCAFTGLASGADLTAEEILRVRAERVETMAKPPSAPITCKRETWVPRAGEAIEYDDCLSGDGGMAILWHHGGPGEGMSRSIYKTVRRGARHIQINQPGIGKSTGGVGWSPERTVDDEARLLEHLGIGAVYTGGWSWGSTMSLLFAQRHPGMVRGVFVGGIWSNSRADVGWYMGEDGSRQYMPGLEKGRLYEAAGKRWSACGLEEALRADPSLSGEYAMMEVAQAGPLTRGHAPVSGGENSAEMVSFAAVESDMMCRGERGKWQLRMKWPKELAGIPLVVVQGRYDQICRPETAKSVYQTWPGAQKVIIWTNGGHWAGGWNVPGDMPTPLTPEQEGALMRQTGRIFDGSSVYLGIAIDMVLQ